MWEAFLLQMNDLDRFDRRLESQLRRMLDPVVAVRPPTRGGRKPIPAVEPLTIELAPEAMKVVEPVPVAVTALPQL